MRWALLMAAASTVLSAVAPGAEASHPGPLLVLGKGAVLQPDRPAVVPAEMSFQACRGLTTVTVTVLEPEPMPDTFEAFFDLLHPASECLGYAIPGAGMHLWNDTIGVDFYGAVETVHLATVVQLAGLYRWQPAAFATAAV